MRSLFDGVDTDADGIWSFLDTAFTFSKRPTPLVAELQPVWRISLLALMLDLCCIGAKSSLRRLHVLNWGVRTEKARAHLLAALNGTRRPQDMLVRIEPSLNRAMDFAIGEGVLEMTKGDRIQLSQAGRALAKEIHNLECFIVEKAFFFEIGKRVTEDWVKQIMLVERSQ